MQSVLTSSPILKTMDLEKVCVSQTHVYDRSRIDITTDVARRDFYTVIFYTVILRVRRKRELPCGDSVGTVAQIDRGVRPLGGVKP